MIDTYCGESAGKKLARSILYSEAKARGMQKGKGTFVVLAGREAAEVAMLRDYLGVSPQRVLFVDRHEAGLRVAERRWHGVQLFQGELSEALKFPHLRPIYLVHADLMGVMSKKTADLACEAYERIEKRGLLAVTYYRGRDRGRLWTADNRMSLSVERNMAAAECIGLEDGLLRGEMLWHAHYRSVSSPMGMVVFLKQNRRRRDARVELLKRALSWSEVDGDEETLKRVVGSWPGPSSEAAALFGVAQGTAAAWRAHATRGSYETPPLLDVTVRSSLQRAMSPANRSEILQDDRSLANFYKTVIIDPDPRAKAMMLAEMQARGL